MIINTILHNRGFSAHDFNTRSGGALRLPFLDSERRSESIFGIQSAPPLSSYIWCWKRAPLSTHIWHSERPSPRFQAIYGVESVPPPLSTHIWHSERPPAFKLYMVLRACPAFNPYLAFRAPPPLSSYILCWKLEVIFPFWISKSNIFFNKQVCTKKLFMR